MDVAFGIVIVTYEKWVSLDKLGDFLELKDPLVLNKTYFNIRARLNMVSKPMCLTMPYNCRVIAFTAYGGMMSNAAGQTVKSMGRLHPNVILSVRG